MVGNAAVRARFLPQRDAGFPDTGKECTATMRLPACRALDLGKGRTILSAQHAIDGSRFGLVGGRLLRGHYGSPVRAGPSGLALTRAAEPRGSSGDLLVATMLSLSR